MLLSEQSEDDLECWVVSVLYACDFCGRRARAVLSGEAQVVCGRRRAGEVAQDWLPCSQGG